MTSWTACDAPAYTSWMRGRADGTIARVVDVEQDEVRGHARLQATDAAGHPRGAGGASGRHRPRFLGSDPAFGIGDDRPVEQRCDLHRLVDVAAIVRAVTVRAERDGHPPEQAVGDGATPEPSFRLDTGL